MGERPAAALSRRAVLAAVLLPLLGCAAGTGTPGGGAPAPSPSVTPSERSTSTPAPSARPERSRPRFDTWVVGSRVLPRRPDGFGVVRPTPRQLRDRLLPTVDVLPPPSDGRYHADIAPVTRRLVRDTDLAWEPGCPVTLDDLRYLRMSFWGFDGRPHTGEMVVNASVAEDVTRVFAQLYDARFPLEQMSLVTRQDLDAPPTGDGNVTAAYACRATRGSTSWSAHAYGLAVDVNPFNNPYAKADLVLPELASSYLDRGWKRPGMIRPGDVVTRAFAGIGWTWGGTFRTVTDLHHFSADGR